MKGTDYAIGALLLFTGVTIAIGFHVLVIYDIFTHGVEKRAVEQEIRAEKLQKNQDEVAERTRKQQEQMAENLRKQQEDIKRRQSY